MYACTGSLLSAWLASPRDINNGVPQQLQAGPNSEAQSVFCLLSTRAYQMIFRVSVQLSEQRSIITSLLMSLRGRNLSPGTLFSEGMHHSSNRAVRSVHWELQQQHKQHEPVVTAWWSQPTKIFLVVSVTCLAFMILSYIMHPQGRQTVAILASTPQSIISSVKEQQQQQPWFPPCSSVPRPAAVCSHRGNASELIQSPADGGGYLRGIELLWHKGVRCFDVDLVQTRDGEVVVGHPAVLASKIRPGRATNIFSQLFGWGFAPNMSQLSPADQLLQWRLPQLRAMGLTSDMAPTVQEAFQVLARLVSESNTSGTSSPLLTGRTALCGRRGGLAAGAPLLMMELKGVAAHSKESFARVAESAAAAGVADSVVLWHILDKGTTLKTDTSRQQQQDAVKQSLAQAAALVRDVRTARPQAANVLMGLGIVDGTDLVLRPEAHHPVAATELLGGVMPEDLDVFDVVGPSIQLPVEALASLSAAKPVIAWVIDDKAQASRGLWLGLDGLISNEPVRVKGEVAALQGTVCSNLSQIT